MTVISGVDGSHGVAIKQAYEAVTAQVANQDSRIILFRVIHAIKISRTQKIRETISMPVWKEAR